MKLQLRDFIGGVLIYDGNTKLKPDVVFVNIELNDWALYKISN